MGSCWFSGSVSCCCLLFRRCLLRLQMPNGLEIEQARRLSGQQPRPVATVEELLSAWIAGATDYRIFMSQGVMARDAAETDRAIELLQKAHQMAPAEPNPALELAFTLERQHGRAAAAIYEEILSRTRRPGRRCWRSAVARDSIARQARDHEQPQNKHPAALNGLAWVALAERNREEARAAFQGVLAPDPKNRKPGSACSSSMMSAAMSLTSTACSSRPAWAPRGVTGPAG